MKKIFKLASLAVLCIYTLGAQNSIVSYGTKTSGSIAIQGVKLYNIQSKKYFLQYTSTGASVFNIKTRLLLIDAQTFKEAGRMNYPEFKGYENLELGTRDNLIEFNGFAAFFMMKKDPKTKKQELYCSKISESFTLAPQPEKLFTIRTQNPFSYLSLKTNDSKDIVLITETMDDKSGIIQRLYDKDLNFKMSDSVTAQTNSGDTISTIMLNDGFAIVAHNTNGRRIKILDVVNNKVIKFAIKNTKRMPMISNLKRIDNKVIMCGNYYSRVSKKQVTNGVFKLVYDLDKNALVEEYYFDHVPKGKGEWEQLEKAVYSSFITPNGFCYLVLSQTTAPAKYELMGIGNNNDKFSKQIPTMYMGSTIEAINNTVYLNCSLCERYDVNNFVYENPLIIKKNLYALDTDLRSSYLRVGPDGKITTHPTSGDAPEFKQSWFKYEEFIGGHEIKDIDYKKTTLTE